MKSHQNLQISRGFPVFQVTCSKSGDAKASYARRSETRIVSGTATATVRPARPSCTVTSTVAESAQRGRLAAEVASMALCSADLSDFFWGINKQFCFKQIGDLS